MTNTSVIDPYSQKYLGEHWDYTIYRRPLAGQYYIGFANNYCGQIFPVINDMEVSAPRGHHWTCGPYQGWHILERN